MLRLQRNGVHLEVSGQRAEEDYVRTRTGIGQTRGAYRSALARVGNRRSTRTVGLPRGVSIDIGIGARYRLRTHRLGVDHLDLLHLALLYLQGLGLINGIGICQVELHLAHTAIGRGGYRELHLGRTLALHGRNRDPLTTLGYGSRPGAVGRNGEGSTATLHGQGQLLDVELEEGHAHIFVVIHTGGKRHGRKQHHHQERQLHPKHFFHTSCLLLVC